MTDLAAPQIVVNEEANNVLLGLSFDSQGNGALFASATATTTNIFAKPHQGSSGFGATERALPVDTDVTSGIAGAWLGGEEMLIAYGTRPADLVELHWTKRSAVETWSAPTRFDTGDGGGNIGVRSVIAAEPGSAFISDGAHRAPKPVLLRKL